MYCRKCGTELKNQEKFCTKCGTATGVSSSGGRISPAAGVSSSGGKSITKLLKILAAAAAVLAAAVSAVLVVKIVFVGGTPTAADPSKLPYVYQKEGYIQMKKSAADEPVKLAALDQLPSQREHIDFDSYRGKFMEIQMSADGKTVFYDTDRLYWRKTNDNSAPSVPENGTQERDYISSPFRYYALSDGKSVVYISSSDLYISNMKKSTLIANDVDIFQISDDEKYILFFSGINDSNTKMYICPVANPSKVTLIDENVTATMNKDKSIYNYRTRNQYFYEKFDVQGYSGMYSMMYGDYVTDMEKIIYGKKRKAVYV